MSLEPNFIPVSTIHHGSSAGTREGVNGPPPCDHIQHCERDLNRLYLLRRVRRTLSVVDGHSHAAESPISGANIGMDWTGCPMTTAMDRLVDA